MSSHRNYVTFTVRGIQRELLVRTGFIIVGGNINNIRYGYGSQTPNGK